MTPRRARLATWLITRRFRGQPPGRRAVKLLEPNGDSMVWAFDGDSIEVFYRDVRRDAVIVRTAVTPANAVRLAKFILAWWARGLWWGLKLRLWMWAVRVRRENSAPEPVRRVEQVRFPVKTA
jgi:hypothetical protein